MSKLRLWAAVLAVSWYGGSALGQPQPLPEESAAQLLSRMSDAIHYLNYEGSFVYLHGDTMEAMHIAHTEQDGYEREHLITLTGPAHQVVRDNYSMTRFEPDRNQLAVSQRYQGAGRAPFLTSFDPERVGRAYDFHIAGSERYAGRMTRKIVIEPRDHSRFGYRLHLDAKYALPLKFDVVDPLGKTVSQLMFTDVRIRHETPQSISEATAKNEGLELPPREPYGGPWRFTALPEGFDLEFFELTESEPGNEIEHFVFFDGMATVSVYVEPGEEPGLNGRQRMGAIGFVGGKKEGHQITVIGEVPTDTLQRVLSGMERMPGSAVHD